MLELMQDAVMPKDKGVKISGSELRRWRESQGLRAEELKPLIGLGVSRVRQVEPSEEQSVHLSVIARIAAIEKITVDEARRRFSPKNPILDANIEPYSLESVAEIPLFDLPIAAGKMTEMPDAEELHEPLSLKNPRFRVRIRGQSMEKAYPDGCVVEFKALQWKQDGRADKLRIGSDYYVQAAECATFKKLESFDDDSYTFAAINRKKFPDKIILPRSDVTLMAKAVARVEFVE